MTPEGKVKVWLRTAMKARYGHLPGFWHYAPKGGAFGQAGTWDDEWLIDHVFVVIESKSGDGSYDVTPLQRKRLENAALGGAVAAAMIGKDKNKLQMIWNEIDRRRELWHRALRESAPPNE